MSPWLSFRGLLTLATFPGVIAHEAAHLIACRLTGTRVFEYRLFQLADPPGYVVHARAASASAGAWIALFPILLNTALAAGAGFSPGVALLTGAGWTGGQAALAWLGFSAGLHAFPSKADASGLWAAAGAARWGWFKRLLVAPLIGLVHVLNWGARLWLDLAYAVLVCLGPAAIWLRSAG